MTHLSRYKLSSRAEKELLQNLKSVFAQIHKLDEMEIFFDALLTPVERIMLAKRLGVVVLVSEGYTDSDIARTLHLTRITVAKMRYFYEARDEGFKVALKRLEEQEQLEGLKKMLISLARYSARAAGGRVKPTVFD